MTLERTYTPNCPTDFLNHKGRGYRHTRDVVQFPPRTSADWANAFKAAHWEYSFQAFHCTENTIARLADLLDAHSIEIDCKAFALEAARFAVGQETQKPIIK